MLQQQQSLDSVGLYYPSSNINYGVNTDYRVI